MAVSSRFPFPSLQPYVRNARPLRDLEPHTDFVNAIGDRFKFDRLIEDRVWRFHRTAIMQPDPDMQYASLSFGQIDMCKRFAVSLADGLGRHFGQRRHKLTMPARVE